MKHCYKCGTRITTHLWLVGARVYCSPGCERGGKSQFERLYKQLRMMMRDNDTG